MCPQDIGPLPLSPAKPHCITHRLVGSRAIPGNGFRSDVASFSACQRGTWRLRALIVCLFICLFK